jgi:hypothetical protein
MLTDEVINAMKAFCARENSTLWEMGDYLNEHRLTDDEMGKLGEIVQRTTQTLRQRENVAREFPIDVRDTSKYAWGIYKELLSVKGAEARQEILDSRSDWTIDSIRLYISDHNAGIAASKGKRGKGVKQQGGTHAGMKLRDIIVRGEISGDEITLTVDHEIINTVGVLPGQTSTIKVSLV